MIETSLPLQQIIQDPNYAWELLDSQIKLELSNELTGDQISRLIQVYMRGVEKTNSVLDIRETFFKTRLNSLMAKQQVRRTLDDQLQKVRKSENKNKTPIRQKLTHKKELQLKAKKIEIEMRVVYGSEEHSSKILHQLLSEQTHKQKLLQTKIDQIMQSHQQKLLNRIKQRKQKTITAKSRSDANFMNSLQANESTKKQSLQNKRDQNFGSHTKTVEVNTPIRKKSIEQHRINKTLGESQVEGWMTDSSNAKNRNISMNFNQLAEFQPSENP